MNHELNRKLKLTSALESNKDSNIANILNKEKSKQLMQDSWIR